MGLVASLISLSLIIDDRQFNQFVSDAYDRLWAFVMYRKTSKF